MNENRKNPNRGSALRAPMLLALLALGVVFFVFLGVKALTEKDPDSTDALASLVTTDRSVPASSSDPIVTDSVATDPASSTPIDSQEIPTTETPTTEIPTTEAPAPVMMTVDDRYFYDALFIGDSRTDGLRLYSNPGDAKSYCATSLNIFKVMDSEVEAYGFTGLRNLLKGMHFGKIYIMFGINECGYATSSFAKKYKEVVDEIRLYQPDAIIYLQSIGYVTQKKENKDSTFSTANIKEKNETIKALANDQDIFYLEVNDALNDGTDHLPAEYTGDGVHLKASYYKLWHDYLLEHAIVDANHPWEPADENTTEPEGAELENP